MSTELKTLQGKIEIPNPPKMSSIYKSTELHLNRFYGGQDRGTSLQIGFYNESGKYSHIQLDHETILELKNILIEEF